MILNLNEFVRAKRLHTSRRSHRVQVRFPRFRWARSSRPHGDTGLLWETERGQAGLERLLTDLCLFSEEGATVNVRAGSACVGAEATGERGGRDAQ